MSVLQKLFQELQQLHGLNSYESEFIRTKWADLFVMGFSHQQHPGLCNWQWGASETGTGLAGEQFAVLPLCLLAPRFLQREAIGGPCSPPRKHPHPSAAWPTLSHCSHLIGISYMAILRLQRVLKLGDKPNTNKPHKRKQDTSWKQDSKFRIYPSTCDEPFLNVQLATGTRNRD